MSHSTQQDCIFCKIGQHTLDASVVFESEEFIAFRDIHPKAKTHVLVVPKIHIGTLSDARTHQKEFEALWDAVLDTASKLGVLDNAKLQLHSGEAAGQEIPHLHVHILSDQDSAS